MPVATEQELIVENAKREMAFLAAKEQYFADPDAEGAFDTYHEAKLAFGSWRRWWRGIRDLAKGAPDAELYRDEADNIDQAAYEAARDAYWAELAAGAPSEVPA